MTSIDTVDVENIIVRGALNRTGAENVLTLLDVSFRPILVSGKVPVIQKSNAARALAAQYYKHQSAARDWLMPTSHLYNSRWPVRLLEVVAVISGTREGGE